MKNNLVRDIRLSLGMSIAEFACSIGASASTISRAENGHVTNELKAKVLRVHKMDDAFFSFVENRKRADSYN